VYVIEDRYLLSFWPRWIVPVDKQISEDRWPDIECWIDFETQAGAASCDDRAFFADKGEAEKFAAAWGRLRPGVQAGGKPIEDDGSWSTCGEMIASRACLANIRSLVKSTLGRQQCRSGTHQVGQQHAVLRRNV
jgi:hypothetical protein